MLLVKKWPFFRLSFLGIQARKMFFTIFQNEKTSFQPINKRRSKSRKIEIFENGLTYGFGQKMAIFSSLFFSQYRAGKFFTIFQNVKTPFQPLKKRSSKSRKIEIFPKGLTHGFGQKMVFFPCLFFKQYRPGKCVLQYSRAKKRLSSP